MTNTINNVPRELLERVLDYDGAVAIRQNARHELRALLSAPSPAGVDGLEVVAYIWSHEKGITVPTMRNKPPFWPGKGGYTSEPLCRQSDAQAIIDGLRGEVADLRSMLTTVSKAGLRVRTDRDQQAQRIGELEAALEFACKSLAQVTSSDGSGHADIAVSVLRMAGRKEADASQIVESYKAGAKLRIDAALSAGKDSVS